MNCPSRHGQRVGGLSVHGSECSIGRSQRHKSYNTSSARVPRPTCNSSNAMPRSTLYT